MYDICNPNEYFDEIRKYDEIILYGCGAKGRQAVIILQEKKIKITAACDNNKELIGKEFVKGIIIQTPKDAIKQKQDLCVIVACSINYTVEICNELKKINSRIPFFSLCNPFKIGTKLLSLNDKIDTSKIINIEEDYNSLEDEESKRIYIDTINWKLTGNVIPLINHDINSDLYSFFDSTFIPVSKENIYVDVGAYTGDTIQSFVMFSRGKYKKIYGIEADYGNYVALEKFVKYSRLPNVETLNYALWSKEEERVWFTNSSNEVINYDSPNLYQSVENIADNITIEKIRSVQETKVKVYTLDQVLQTVVPTIIKINALAADLKIIFGGKNIIENHKPILIMEFGVIEEDVLSTMKIIKSINEEYRFYMRRKKIFGDIKTILYCI